MTPPLVYVLTALAVAICADIAVKLVDRLVELFEKGFSTREHLFRASKELSND